MEFFLSYRFIVSGTTERRPLTDHDIARAHGLGGDWLARWKKEKASAFSAVANLGSSGVVPLIGFVALDWSATLIVLAIMIDIVTIWFTDVLKSRLASEDVQYQLDLSEDTDKIYRVALATSSRSIRYVDNRIDPESVRAERTFSEFSPKGTPITSCLFGETMFCFLATMVIVPWIFIFPASNAVLANATWESWALVCSSAAIRLVVTLVTLALSRAGRTTASLSPGSYLPTMLVLITTIVSATMLGILPFDWFKENSGAIILTTYAVINLLVAYFVRHSMQEREKVIAEFLRKGPRPETASIGSNAAAIS